MSEMFLYVVACLIIETFPIIVPLPPSSLFQLVPAYPFSLFSAQPLSSERGKWCLDGSVESHLTHLSHPASCSTESFSTASLSHTSRISSPN